MGKCQLFFGGVGRLVVGIQRVTTIAQRVNAFGSAELQKVICPKNYTSGFMRMKLPFMTKNVEATFQK